MRCTKGRFRGILVWRISRARGDISRLALSAWRNKRPSVTQSTDDCFLAFWLYFLWHGIYNEEKKVYVGCYSRLGVARTKWCPLLINTGYPHNSTFNRHVLTVPSAGSYTSNTVAPTDLCFHWSLYMTCSLFRYQGYGYCLCWVIYCFVLLTLLQRPCPSRSLTISLKHPCRLNDSLSSNWILSMFQLHPKYVFPKRGFRSLA